MHDPEDVSDAAITDLSNRFEVLKGVQLDILRLPRTMLKAFEPSQIGTIVGSLMDACIPELGNVFSDASNEIPDVGLTKHEGILGEREGYPDYRHEGGFRLELKLLYKDPENVEMKKPPTPREPSARLTQKVTVKNVDPQSDLLMVIVYQLQSSSASNDWFSPTIIDIGLFPMIHCILARDNRLITANGKWFGDMETSCIPSKLGRAKLNRGELLDESQYGRKQSENKDYNEDTNFGKLKRIPYKPLQLFLKEHNASYATTGDWPEPWRIDELDEGHGV